MIGLQFAPAVGAGKDDCSWRGIDRTGGGHDDFAPAHQILRLGHSQ